MLAKSSASVSERALRHDSSSRGGCDSEVVSLAGNSGGASTMTGVENPVVVSSSPNLSRGSVTDSGLIVSSVNFGRGDTRVTRSLPLCEGPF